VLPGRDGRESALACYIVIRYTMCGGSETTGCLCRWSYCRGV
jgi:hypothetical protein